MSSKLTTAWPGSGCATVSWQSGVSLTKWEKASREIFHAFFQGMDTGSHWLLALRPLQSGCYCEAPLFPAGERPTYLMSSTVSEYMV